MTPVIENDKTVEEQGFKKKRKNNWKKREDGNEMSADLVDG